MSYTTTASRQLADDMAPVLDELDRPGWTVEATEYDWNGVELVSPEGIPFRVLDYANGYSRRASERGKVNIVVGAPDGLAEHWPSRGYGVKRAELTASIERGPQAIAKDVSRKLLDQARRELAHAKANKADSDAADAWEQTTMAAVAETLGVPAPERPEERWNGRDWHPKVSARPSVEDRSMLSGFRHVDIEPSRYSHTVSLNVHDVSPEVALRIAAVLAESEPWTTW
jgi:hypothetical protein